MKISSLPLSPLPKKKKKKLENKTHFLTRLYLRIPSPIPSPLLDYPNLYEAIRILKGLPSPPSADIPALPPRSPSKKLTLVLDMDETLIHSEVLLEDRDETSLPKDSFTLSVRLPYSGKTQRLLIRKRPHLDYFLSEVEKHWEVVVFTASLSLVAVPILNTLDPERTLIQHRLFRDACYITSPNSSLGGCNHYIKNLNILGRPLCSTLLVDNSLEAFGFQLGNGLLIQSWEDDPYDDELLRVLKTLRDIQINERSVPEYIHEHHNLSVLLPPPVNQ